MLYFFAHSIHTKGINKTMSDSKSLGEQNYETFAYRYAEFAPNKPHNALYDRPATLSLLPDVSGKRVLDAGCGPGIYTEILLERGAEVVAVDVTPAFIEITLKRVGNRATVLRADLTQPLHFAEDESFDVVLCPLVLDYIADWRPVFQEFYRVLKPGGAFVFSCGHPFGDWFFAQRTIEVRYFDIQQFTGEWGGFGDPKPKVTAYRRPFTAIIPPLLASGFLLETFLEPLPTEAFKTIDPTSYEQLMEKPGFLCIRGVKPAT